MSASVPIPPMSISILPKIIEDATSLHNALQMENFDKVDQKMQQLVEDYKVLNPKVVENLQEIHKQLLEGFLEARFLPFNADADPIKASVRKCEQQMMEILSKDVPDFKTRLDRQKYFIDACLKKEFASAEKILKDGPINIKSCTIVTSGLSLIEYAFAKDEDLMEFLLKKGNLSLQDIKESVAQPHYNDVIIKFLIGFKLALTFDVNDIKKRLFKFLPLFIGIGFDINSELNAIEEPDILMRTMLRQVILRIQDIEIIRFLVFYGAGCEEDKKLLKLASCNGQLRYVTEPMRVRRTILKEMQRGKPQLEFQDLQPAERVVLAERCAKRMEFLDLLNIVSTLLDMLKLQPSGKADRVGDVMYTSIMMFEKKRITSPDKLKKSIEKAKKEDDFQREYDQFVEEMRKLFPETYRNVERHMQFTGLCQLGELEKAQQVFEAESKDSFFDLNACMVLREDLDLIEGGEYVRHPLLNYFCTKGDSRLVNFLIQLGVNVNHSNLLHGYAGAWPPAIIETAICNPPKGTTSQDKEIFIKQQEEVLSQLMLAKADVNLSDWNGNSFVEIFCGDKAISSLDAIHSLIKCGWTIKNNDTPFLNWFFNELSVIGWDDSEQIGMYKQIIYYGGFVSKRLLEYAPKGAMKALDSLKDAVKRRDTILRKMICEKLADGLPGFSLDLVGVVTEYAIDLDDLDTNVRLELARRCNQEENLKDLFPKEIAIINL